MIFRGYRTTGILHSLGFHRHVQYNKYKCLFANCQGSYSSYNHRHFAFSLQRRSYSPKIYSIELCQFVPPSSLHMYKLLSKLMFGVLLLTPRSLFRYTGIFTILLTASLLANTICASYKVFLCNWVASNDTVSVSITEGATENSYLSSESQLIVGGAITRYIRANTEVTI